MQDAVVTGDVDDLGTLYHEQADRLWRAVLLFCGDREIASDAVAEAFTRAIENRGGIRTPEAWIWKVAFRLAAQELRRRSREEHVPADAPYEVPQETGELMRALQHLSSRQRAAIVLHFQAGYSYAEVARIVGSTPAAVGVHIHRGRRKLRAMLGDEDV